MADGGKDPKSGASLTYYIFEGVLVGVAGGRVFHLFARSGGVAAAPSMTPISTEATICC